MRNLNYYWRILATGFCFTCFGIGGLILSTIVFPLINLLPISKDRTRRIAQSMVHYSFRLFIGLMQFVGVLRIHINGKELLTAESNNLLIANHPTLIDVIVLISLMKQTDCVVKESLWNNPFTSGIVKATGYINNSSPEQVINDCVNSICNGRSLIIFPEGTRTTPGVDYKFQRGASHIALRARKNLLPATITCSPTSLTKEESWYQIPKGGPVHLYVSIKNSIEVQPFIENSKNMLQASRHLNQFLHTYYKKEVFANDRLST